MCSHQQFLAGRQRYSRHQCSKWTAWHWKAQRASGPPCQPSLGQQPLTDTYMWCHSGLHQGSTCNLYWVHSQSVPPLWVTPPRLRGTPMSRNQSVRRVDMCFGRQPRTETPSPGSLGRQPGRGRPGPAHSDRMRRFQGYQQLQAAVRRSGDSARGGEPTWRQEQQAVRRGRRSQSRTIGGPGVISPIS
jgi:hypothetical protein